jgi:predicted unusual protein kinase regulating ubiquinone biosynthesis (AarF/ABC1/UbiB family)
LGREEVVEFAREFGDLLYNMPFQVPENFILFGRCVGILSGICSGLDQDFNIWSQIAPYAQKLVSMEHGSSFQFLKGEVTDTLRLVAGLPRRGDNLLTRIEQGKLSVQMPELKHSLDRIERSTGRVPAAIVFAVFFLAAIQLYLAGNLVPAAAVGGAALITLVILIFK